LSMTYNHSSDTEELLLVRGSKLTLSALRKISKDLFGCQRAWWR
jgi:hypothetical protein